jgi:hypothetical protein
MDALPLIRDPCGTRNCAQESLESLGRPEAGALLDRHGHAVADRTCRGCAPLPRPRSPGSPGPASGFRPPRQCA